MGNEDRTGSFGYDLSFGVCPAFDPPFDVVDRVELTCPLIFSSRHSGCSVPLAVEVPALEPLQLRRSEMLFRRLFAEAASISARRCCARFPRAYLDLNQRTLELVPRMFSGRLPSCANTRSVSRRSGAWDDRPHHSANRQDARPGGGGAGPDRGASQNLACDAATALLERTHRLFEIRSWWISFHAVLRDGDPGQRQKARNRFRSWRPLRHELRQADCRRTRAGNSGAWIWGAAQQALCRGLLAEHYGAPSSGFHAIQIEVNRALYMHERRIERSERFASVAASLKLIAEVLADSAAKRGGVLKAAAE